MTKAINVRGDHGDETRTYTSKPWPLGTRMHLPDGRVYRSALNGATALVRARVAQVARRDVSLADLAINLPRSGPRAFTVTPATTGRIAPDTYEDGLFYVNDGTGEGYAYRVAGNPERVAASPLSLYLDSDWVVSPDTSTRGTLLRNRYSGLLVASAPPTEVVVGVVPVTVAASNYFWLQTSGPSVVLQQDDLEAYLPVQASKITSGTVELATVVVPNVAGERHGAEGLVVEPVFDDDAGPLKGRIASRSGVGVVPSLSIGYVLSPREHGQHCLVQLILE